MSRVAFLRTSVAPTIAVLTLGGAAAFGAGYPRLGGPLATLLVGMTAWLAWDARRRLGALAQLQRQGDRVNRAAGAEVQESIRRSERRLFRAGRETVRDVEALLQLVPQVAPRALMPPSGFWAMDPRNLAHLVDVVRRRRPRTVLELGGGTSTIWLGYLLEEMGGRLVSVDHDPAFADITRAAVRRHGLADVVEVRVAPLAPVEGADADARWYDASVFSDVVGIELLVIDGPPMASGPRARSYALPRLASQMAPDFAVVLDDAERPDETIAVEEWLDAVPGLERDEVGVSNVAVLRRAAG